MSPTKNAILVVLIVLLIAAIILDWNNWVFSGLLLVAFLVVTLYRPGDGPRE